MPRPRPPKLKRKTGIHNGPPRRQERFAELLVMVPSNRVDQLNAAMASATGREADNQTFVPAYSADGQEPATHAVARFYLSDALDTRGLVQQLAGNNNPNIQASIWPAGDQSDLTTLTSDYLAHSNVDVRGAAPDVATWLADHGLMAIETDEVTL